MAFQSSVPPSVLAKLAKSAEGEEEDGEPTKKREDYKKLKELEEMRKAGTAPAMKDEEGKDINPHIPQYIMQAPWYFGITQATLRHQRIQPGSQKKYSELTEWYKRGVKEGPVATKFRKGACENCGAITHKKKDCLERPRKTGARFTNSNIAPDEHLQPNLSMDFDGKRDRWNGYSLDEHKKIVEEFQKIEEAKKQLKADSLAQEESEAAAEKHDDDDDDEDKYAEEMAMPGQKFETKQRITVRNLRIREDTAKYLYNLDVNSAHYDPKTRSMRENPFENTGKGPQDIPYAGDNFVRMSGDAMGIAQRQMFAWEAYEKGAEVHLQADPTKLEMLASEFKQRKKEFKTATKDSIVQKYGGEEHLEAPPKQLLLAQTEDYVEYSRHGTVIKGQEKAVVKSRYEEDNYLNNHTSVWGSYWKDGKWGFKCCSSLIKESYCTGQTGKEVAATSLPGIDEPSTSVTSAEAAERLQAPVDDDASEHAQSSADGGGEAIDEEEQLKDAILRLKQQQQEKKQRRKEKKKQKKMKKKQKKAKKRKKKESSSSSSESESEDEEAVKEKKIREAMRKEDERIREVDKMLSLDERKRKYNSMYDDVAPTEEEIEAFRRKQKRFDDPMAHC